VSSGLDAGEQLMNGIREEIKNFKRANKGQKEAIIMTGSLERMIEALETLAEACTSLVVTIRVYMRLMKNPGYYEEKVSRTIKMAIVFSMYTKSLE
jgi:hypothetical protein